MDLVKLIKHGRAVFTTIDDLVDISEKNKVPILQVSSKYVEIIDYMQAQPNYNPAMHQQVREEAVRRVKNFYKAYPYKKK